MINSNYAVVTLDDGSTFGQVVIGKTTAEIEAESAPAANGFSRLSRRLLRRPLQQSA
jgi:hypothetical protein